MSEVLYSNEPSDSFIKSGFIVTEFKKRYSDDHGYNWFGQITHIIPSQKF